MFFPGLLLSLLLRLTTQTSVHRPAGHVTFRDVAQQAGINFVNVFGGAKAKRYLLESTGSGVAWIDYDRDGYPDLFLVKAFDGRAVHEKKVRVAVAVVIDPGNAGAGTFEQVALGFCPTKDVGEVDPCLPRDVSECNLYGGGSDGRLGG